MKQKLDIDLPNLSEYRQLLVEQGAIVPLSIVPFSNRGLLAELPPPLSGKTGWPWTLETNPLPIVMSNGLPWPKISIVTPSYNQGQFIEETIRSVLLQNYPNLEFIIFDGGSNDETQQVLEKYSPWLSFWQSKKDRGQGHAINLGFSLASGEYFGWINSDDFYLPDCFQLVATHFSKYSSDFIYGDAVNLYDSEYKISYWQGNIVLDRYLRFGGLIAAHAAFWKSSIHQPIWEKMNCNVDGELWIRLLPSKTKSHLRIPLGVYRLQPDAKTSHVNYHHLWREDDENIAAIYGLPPQPHSFVTYECVLVQRFYKSVFKSIKGSISCSLLQQCSWENQYIFVD